MEDNRDAHAASPKSCEEGPESLSLKQVIREHERHLVEAALRRTGGSVTRAAKLLGVSHQTLAAMLKTRHRELLSLRTPVVQRRRSIIVEKEKVEGPKVKAKA